MALLKSQCLPGLNAGHPLSRALLYYIPMIEGGGGPADLVSGLRSTVTGTYPWTNDKYGAQLSGDGTGNRTNLASFANNPKLLPSGSNFTFAVLMRPTSFSGQRWVAGVGSSFATSSTGKYLLQYTDFGGIGGNRFEFDWTSTGASYRRGYNPPSTGVWTMVVATVVSDAVSAVYYNGVAQTVQQTGGTGIAQTTAALEIGNTASANNNANIAFDGKIALVAAWDRALTQAEVVSLTNEPYQLLATPRARIGNSVSAGAFLAAWARGNNQVIAGGSYVS